MSSKEQATEDSKAPENEKIPLEETEPAKTNPLPSVVGPFIGAVNSHTVRICVGLPDTLDTEITCRIFEDGNLVASLTSKPEFGIHRTFTFEFSGLKPETEYQYEFSSALGPIDLEGLEASDLRFRPIGDGAANESFILLSCHNPFEYSPASEGWLMWERLGQLLVDDSTVRLLLLGGDQVYHDKLEKEFLAALRVDSGAPSKEMFQRALIKNYQKFWGDLRYRRVLARVPSVAMWDDHDITDGWGGRPESFDIEGKTFPHWVSFFEGARASFEAYQACRNPLLVPDIPLGSFSSVLDWGDNRFYLCDFRSGKNSGQNLFWTIEHEQAFLRSLSNAKEKRIFVLSPVVPFRADPDDDDFMTGITKSLWEMRQREVRNEGKGFTRTIRKFVLAIFGGATGFVDDLEDALMAPCNRDSFIRLLRQLFEAVRGGKEVFILSGDIHCAGISEFVETGAERSLSIPQFVSSPIAYKPMDRKFAGATTAAKKVEIKNVEKKEDVSTSKVGVENETEKPAAEKNAEQQPVIFARNGPYIADRNFLQISPSKFKNYSNGLPLAYHFENHPLPMALPGYLSPVEAKAD